MKALRRVRWEDLDPAEQVWFAAHSGAALGRRDARFFAGLRARWLGWVLTGASGLLGLLLFDWSPSTAILLLVAGFWSGWTADVLLLVLRAACLPLAYARDYDDARSWQIVDILRGKRDRLPDVPGGPPLMVSVVADLVTGLAACALLWRGMEAARLDVLAELRTPTLWLAVLGVLVASTIPLLRARLVVDAQGGVELPVFRAGQRGIGLLVLVFATMAIGGGVLPTMWVVAGVNAFLLVMGAVELAVGVPGLRAQAKWLREERARRLAE